MSDWAKVRTLSHLYLTLILIIVSLKEEGISSLFKTQLIVLINSAGNKSLKVLYHSPVNPSETRFLFSLEIAF